MDKDKEKKQPKTRPQPKKPQHPPQKPDVNRPDLGKPIQNPTEQTGL